MSILSLLAGTPCLQHLEVPRYFFVLACMQSVHIHPQGGDEAHQRGKHCILEEINSIAAVIGL